MSDARRALWMVGALVVGMFAGFVAGAEMVSAGYRHDPVKLLALHDKCMETDRHITTTWCDSYAEEYSRIEGDCRR